MKNILITSAGKRVVLVQIFQQTQKDLGLEAKVYTTDKNECFLNIVEEPEQNLFPISQKEVLHKLLSVFNSNPFNGLIITTHSPYIIDELSLAVKAGAVLKKGQGKNIYEKIEKVIPVASCLNVGQLAIYEIRKDGCVVQLPNYDGLPSDDNYLNMSLMDSNERFNQLLEIEDELEG